ncbi:MAG: hypothetical protein IPH03_18320 [Tetrasphaera sp.]|nr:hypothetical protein [Tetrasphaera sp.]
MVLATFGADRVSSVVVPADGASAPPPAPDGLPALPHLPGVTPTFAHVDRRLATGAFPSRVPPVATLTGFMRFRMPTATFTLAHFVALVDACRRRRARCSPAPWG